MPYNRELTIKEELMLAFRDAIIRMPNSEEDNSWRVKRNVAKVKKSYTGTFLAQSFRGR